MGSVKSWVRAFRLRTLPLAFAGTFVGSFLAAKQSIFRWEIFLFSLFTTLVLQILSNLANDYGDYSKGTDNDDRIGPARALQSGAISVDEMRRMIFFFVILSLVFGVLLVYAALTYISPIVGVFFICLGILAIFSAISYTMGKRAYGFKGLGDVFVFLFFGPVSVYGVWLLHGGAFSLTEVLPSLSMGLLSVAVLNINNLRDIDNDRNCGKNTLPVKFGFFWGKRYHVVVVLTSFVLLLLFTILTYSSVADFLWCIVIPFVYQQVRGVFYLPSDKLDPYLKKMALTSFSVSILLWVSLLV